MKARQVFAMEVPGKYLGANVRMEHLFVIDDRGRLWERFSDDEPGKWSEVPLPNRTQTRGRRARKG